MPKPRRKSLVKPPPVKPYDAAFKHLVEIRPGDFLALAQTPDVNKVEMVDAELSTVVAAADKVLKVWSGQGEYLVNLEFQSGPDQDLLGRLFWYNVILYRRHRLPVWTILILLTRGADSPRRTGTFEIRMPGGQLCHTFEYQVLRIWEMKLQDVIGGGLALLPLAPLCDEAIPHVREVVQKMKQRLDKEADSAEKDTLWAATYFLMGLRYERDLVAQLIPGGKGMKESVTYQATLAEGRAEGRAEGALQEARKMLLRLGGEILGKPSAQISAALQAISEVQELELLSERLLKVASWPELFNLPESRRTNGKKRSPGK